VKTLVDTTSLISLALWETQQSEFTEWNRKTHRLELKVQRDEYATMCRQLQPAVDALVLYDDVLVDYVSYTRNISKFPLLSDLASLCTFINDSASSESECYHLAATVLTPLITSPGDWLVDALRRHITELDTIELSVCGKRYTPSTYWCDLAGTLSKSENELVEALEGAFGEGTPFSGAALAALVRLFYYVVAQEMHQCSLSLHPFKGIFLNGVERRRWFGEENEQRIAKTILDAFDAELKQEYLDAQTRWFGGTDLTFSPPLLTENVINRALSLHGLLEAIVEVRESAEARDFRAAISGLANEVSKGNRRAVELLLADMNKQKVAWEKRSGRSKLGDSSTGIKMVVPLLRGLGARVQSLVPKRSTSDSERIFTFLYMISDS
jgi:hypothetical protein